MLIRHMGEMNFTLLVFIRNNRLGFEKPDSKITGITLFTTTLIIVKPG